MNFCQVIFATSKNHFRTPIKTLIHPPKLPKNLVVELVIYQQIFC